MGHGTCSICHGYKSLYDNGACGSCQAQKAGEKFGEWLIDFIVKKIKSIFTPK